MALLTKQKIFAAPKRVYNTVEVPEWGGEVRLRSLSGKERDAFEASLSTTRGTKTKASMENVRARLIAITAVDEAGDLLFTNSKEVDALGDGQVAPLQRVFSAAQAMNGFSDADLEKLMEDFKPDPDEVSTSG